jgi:hypothetical protein
MPGIKQDGHHTYAPAIGRRDRAPHRNSRGAPTKGRRIATDLRLPIFHLVYRQSTYEFPELTPASLVFGRELLLSCELLFGASPDKVRPTIDHAENLLDRLHDTHNYARQHLKLAVYRLKTRYDRLAN